MIRHKDIQVFGKRKVTANRI